MALDLSLQAVLNTAGGLAFVAAGVLALALSKGDRRGRLVGALAVAFGAYYGVSNLWPPVEPAAFVAASVTAGALTVCAMLVVAHFARTSDAQARVGLALASTTIGVVSVGSAAAVVLDPVAVGEALDLPRGSSMARIGGLSTAAFIVSTGALALAVAAAGLALRSTREGPERRALQLFGAAFGMFVVFTTSFVWLELPWFLVANVVAWTAIACWVVAIDGPRTRNVVLALVAAGLAGHATSLTSFLRGGHLGIDFGVPGVLRTFGAFLLVLALLRHGLGGTTPRPHRVRRGMLATGTLAVLLIVAQVAQNFLEAQYGLLMGGVVAGAFLFAAHPLQRAFEGRGERAAPVEGAREGPERSYRQAVRMALKDGHITREEERELVILAEHLGISASRAYALRDEVERATSAR